jgi:hypothetical protein
MHGGFCSVKTFLTAGGGQGLLLARKYKKTSPLIEEIKEIQIQPKKSKMLRHY